MTNSTNTQGQKLNLEKQKNEDFQFLIENNVRYSIVSCISIFQEPLNLSMMSKLTGHPITTIIHHIPQILDRGLIKVEKIPGRRGKFYNITSKFIEIRKQRSKDIDEEILGFNFDEKKKLSKSEYKKELFFEIKKNLESKEITSNIGDVIKSLGVFNNNIAKISSEYMNYLIRNMTQGYSDKLKIGLSEPSISQTSISISNVSQSLELQKLFFDFYYNLGEVRKKFDLENEKVDEKELEKVYLYFFTTPIVDITDNS